MLCGLRQAIEIGREAFCLGAWRHTVGAHEPQLNTRGYARPPFFSRQYLLYNTVVICPMLTSALRSECLSTPSVTEVTQDSSPGVSSTAFRAQSPDLRSASLMEVDFAVS